MTERQQEIVGFDGEFRGKLGWDRLGAMPAFVLLLFRERELAARSPAAAV